MELLTYLEAVLFFMMQEMKHINQKNAYVEKNLEAKWKKNKLHRWEQFQKTKKIELPEMFGTPSD